jgi:hypothetical protein
VEPNQVPNGISITSGEIGTHAMHLPGERSIDINNWQKQKAILNRHARAGAAAGPYAEHLFQ